ncbi:Uncharacterized protein OS=Singulisphaera acidiphila (strain ATCC BAA-1392 / DSM 18658 / VKM B-2454 / MOB10) GN=Sinac_3477 PE=4 SV=1: SBP_bac_10 [Gemmata massiliana]|uniref:DUF1559 domain-containing protein n=1 Tax=Gemmata massiliana TaxID=1210884 RepID=A0A6P2CSJ6_9BACT|nr:DUF1559 domain-containing protein [Gemmata massiliana]VTR91901.1 Uncharacterized protein OS=Singulisphaera acidiphila (strain ATCC BAA-1392 / DSM 18658 / VKM B-2454 / MOB10) GN=Sinac_3477 PE=4 SV=1: SBP_bac_10 [Gemmata massiliana]
MSRSPGFRWRATQCAALGLLVAIIVTIAPFGTTQPVSAQPPAGQLPVELRYVPHDAAFFLYADAAKIWSHEATKSFRDADKNTFGLLEGAATKVSGMKITDLKNVVVFYPNLKQPQDTDRVGFILTFTKAFDKKKLEDGLTELLLKNAKIKVSAPDEKTALVLVGLDDEYAKPRLSADDGPLSSAIKAAASGKHALVVGTALGSLPDEIRMDNLPAQVRPFQPIFHATALTATLDLGKSLDLNVRVKTKRAAQAVDAEKALAALAKLLGDELTGELPNLEKGAADNEGLKDVVKALKAVVAAAKGAKFEVDDTEARMTATLPLTDLPLATAYAAGVQAFQAKASVSSSANNLKQIALAMHNYHDANNAFPPAAVCDKKGKPQLSWRVLILPYIEQDALYKEFKLDEPWDSEHNKKLIAKMPKVYAMPGKSKPGDTDTYYRVFVGNGASFDWLMGTSLVGITDGTSNTFMCATGATAVPWTKPDELEFDPEKDNSKLIGLVVNGKAQVAMCDGSVRTLSKIPAKETLNALITRSGGEVIGNDF